MLPFPHLVLLLLLVEFRGCPPTTQPLKVAVLSPNRVAFAFGAKKEGILRKKITWGRAGASREERKQ